MKISALLSFLSVIFWAWVLGATGAILAVPLTVLIRDLVFGPENPPDVGPPQPVSSSTVPTPQSDAEHPRQPEPPAVERAAVGEAPVDADAATELHVTRIGDEPAADLPVTHADDDTVRDRPPPSA
jgi:hypothetical protein